MFHMFYSTVLLLLLLILILSAFRAVTHILKGLFKLRVEPYRSQLGLNPYRLMWREPELRVHLRSALTWWLIGFAVLMLIVLLVATTTVHT